jgi:ATP-dependent Clp protease ATP-binding subunit ClpA
LRREGSLERERLIKELNDLVDKNVIFKIDSISYAEEERPVSYSIKEGAEGFSLDKVLTEVFGDREIAELIRDFIDEKIDEKTLMNRLREDKDFLDKLHKIIRETRL